jgi:hypothetical protein
MRQRCRNVRCHAFARYGGRGIAICAEWERFEDFRDWALANSYAANLTLDRIDNDGNYEPGNCQWISKAEQNLNKSNLRAVVRSDGKRFPTIAAAARDLGCSQTSIIDVCRGRQLTSHGYGWRYE